MNSAKQDELLKLSQEVTASLRQATDINGVLLKKQAEHKEKISALMKVAQDQSVLIDAQTQAIFMAKEGEIDAEQIQDVVDRILKFGSDLYKEALMAGMSNESTSFGEVMKGDDSPQTGLEKTAHTPTYNGVEVSNPVEQVLLDFRAQQYGTPELNWA